jgi:C-terminal processing protease CtpA/Prc
MMKQLTLIMALALSGALVFSPVAMAAAEAPAEAKAAKAQAAASAQAATKAQNAAQTAQQASTHAKLEAEYKHALAEADRSRAEANATIEKAREQIHLESREQRRETAERKELSAKERAELAAMREELSRAHGQLRESSREISRVNRDLARAKMDNFAPNFVFSSVERPVLGVVLGDSNDIGIEVLGVSPDGPADRAGVETGDVIIAIGGRVLSAVEDSDDIRDGLNIALRDINVGEAVIVAVERASETLDLIVVPEVREPLTWQSVVRFPSAPTSPGDVGDTVIIERIMVPEIDTEKLSEQIEHMRVEVEERRALMKVHKVAPVSQTRQYEFRFDEMSEMGDFALHDTNAWFGMPLASGLRLAEIDPALGEYFKTDRGVLVLKAKEDNGLLLQSGDVVLNVHGTEVNSPADFMRALRNFEPGDELVLDIKRNRKSKTLKPIIEESQSQFFEKEDHELHTITITSDSN